MMVTVYAQELPSTDDSVVQQVFGLVIASVGLASFALVIALVEQVHTCQYWGAPGSQISQLAGCWVSTAVLLHTFQMCTHLHLAAACSRAQALKRLVPAAPRCSAGALSEHACLKTGAQSAIAERSCVLQLVLQILDTNVRQGSTVYEKDHLLVLGWLANRKDEEVVWKVLSQVCTA